MYIPLIIFLIACGVQLYACWMELDRLRIITKLTLMPLLLVSYVVAAKTVSPLLVMALVCGGLGDYFLTHEKEPQMFISGLMTFLAGHIFYISVIATKMVWTEAYVYLLIALIVSAAGCLIFNHMMKEKLGEARTPAFIYSAVLMILASLSFSLLVSSPSLQNGLLFAGSILFLASDTILSYNIFDKEWKHGNFYVMATYIPAQALIIAGLIAR